MKRKKGLIATTLLLFLAIMLAAGGKYFALNHINPESRNNTVALWNYTRANNISGFNFPVNYQEYVMPENPLVQEYARKLEVGLYWNYLTYQNGSVFYIEYQPDTEEGIWQNPDYTLAVGHGDCEDIALTVASILEAKGIKAVVVMGYIYINNDKKPHSWVEYYLNGRYYISDNFSYEREVTIENKIVYYSPPSEIMAALFEKPPVIKYQPRYIFNDNLKKTPYSKDWATWI